MNWDAADIVVGVLALVLGALSVCVALFDVSYFYRLRKSQWFEERWSRRSTRVYYASLGAAFLFVGAIILFAKPFFS